MAHICILYAVENQAFATKLERALIEMDHSISRREIDGDGCAILGAVSGEPDAMVVIWSAHSVASPTLIGQARNALGRRTLTPVAIGKIEPPASFEHLWPIDLSGWTGALEDPRWRFVTDEINLSIRRSELGFEDLSLGAFREEDDEPESRGLGRVAFYAAGIIVCLSLIGFIGFGPSIFGTKEAGGSASGVAFVEPSGSPSDFAAEPLAVNDDDASGVAANEADNVLLAEPSEDDASQVTAEVEPVGSGELEVPQADEGSELPELMSVSPAVELAENEALPTDEPNRGDASQEVAVSDEVVSDAVPSAASLPDDLAAENIQLAEAPSLKPGEVVSQQEAADPAIPEGDPLAETIAAATEESLPETAEVEPEKNTDDLDRLIVASAVLAEQSDAVLPAQQSAQENAYLGNYFRECVECPDMAALEGGGFLMGSPINERARQDTEFVARDAVIPNRFAIGTREVTFNQWAACVADNACASVADSGWGRGNRPVVNVSWADAQNYTQWLSLKTGQAYRLPTEAEWEYAARAGARTPFAFGNSVTPQQANFNGKYGYNAAAGLYRGRTMPVASFAPNAFGLFDMHGNVWEWTSDCWDETQGSACEGRVLKGGAWNSGGWRLRAGHRLSGKAQSREFDNGFRVARSLP